MKDYKCVDSIFKGISKDFAEANNFSLPGLYQNADEAFAKIDILGIVKPGSGQTFCGTAEKTGIFKDISQMSALLADGRVVFHLFIKTDQPFPA